MYAFPDIGNLTCFYPSNLEKKFIVELDEDSFVCPIEVDCPKPCDCSRRAKDNVVSLNCAWLNLKEVNISAPANTTVLYFQNNYLKDLKDLRITNWNDTVKLWLDHNLLESIEAANLPESLQVLSVTSNRLKTISESVQNFLQNRNTFAFYTANNTWDCSCSALNLKYWLQKHTHIMRDIDNITCQLKISDNTKHSPLYTIPDEHLCPPKLREKKNNDMMLTVVISSIFTILVLTLALTYYKNKQTVLAYAYIHCNCLFRCLFGNADLDEDKAFDAFIAYCSRDQDLVMNIIEELENKEPHFKLCIHERDWIPGNYISQNIVFAVQNSKRIIVILSEDFISSMWFVVEVRTALFQMLEDKLDRLIFVIVGNPPNINTLDEDIQQLIQRKTYLEWGKRWFWDKLRYAMPHYSNLRTQSGFSYNVRQTRLIKVVEKEISSVQMHTANPGSPETAVI